MATKWTSPTWRMPEESNQSKFENYSLDFGGASADFIDCGSGIGNSIGENYTGGMAISFWFKADSGGSSEKGFFIFEGSTSWGEITAYLYLGKLELRVQGDDKNLDYTFSDTSSFHHLLINFLGPSSDNKVYLDGQVIGPTFTYTSSGLDLNGEDLKIGYTYSTSYPFRGKMSDFCVFENSLSSDQINYLYNSGTPQNPMAISGNAPIAYYPLGGGSTGSSSTLTTPNDSVPSATVFDFIDGNDTFIDCGANENILDFSGNDYTVSTWVNWDGTGDSNQMIASVKSDGEHVDFALTIEQSTGKIAYWNGSTYVKSNSAIPTGVWCMVTIIVKSSQKDFFINGVADGTPLQTRVASAAAGTKFLIGKSNYGSEFINGKVSNLQIWDSSLLSSEITTLYNYGSPLSGTQPQAANLKAWYKMGVDTSNWDGSNWTIGDSTANYSNALNFDGASGTYILVGNNNSLSGPYTGYTISAWAKTPVSWEADYNVIFSKKYSFYFGLNSSHYLVLNPGSGTAFAVEVTSTTALSLNTWYHFLVTADGTNVKLYINGSLDKTQATINTAQNSNTSNTPYISGYSNAGDYDTWKGELSNIGFYNSALTSAQVQTLYNSGSPEASISHSPISWWKLDNTTTGIQDSGSASNNGTNNGATQVPSLVSTLNGTSSGMNTANLVNSDLTRSIPYSSYSLDFDAASNTRISLGTAPTLSSVLTISAWFKKSSLAPDSAGIFGTRNSTSLQIPYLLSDAGSEKIRFRICQSNSVTVEVISASALSNDVWYNVVGVADGSNINVYINGVPETPVSYNGTIITPTNDLTIGAQNEVPALQPYDFDGLISNCALWNSALNQDDILTIYNGGVPNDISSLSPTGWWSLAGDSYFNGTDFICPDLSSNSNDGTSSGMGGTELVGNGPGSTGSGTATGMNIPANLQGNAPNSTKNAFSINMAADDKTSSVPDISS